MIERLKSKWCIKSTLDIILILIVFSLAGSSSIYVGKYFFFLVGVTDETAGWIRILVRIVFLLPAYQILTIIYAVLLGQFYFFWPKQKAIGRFLLKSLGIKK